MNSESSELASSYSESLRLRPLVPGASAASISIAPVELALNFLILLRGVDMPGPRFLGEPLSSPLTSCASALPPAVGCALSLESSVSTIGTTAAPPLASPPPPPLSRLGTSRGTAAFPPFMFAPSITEPSGHRRFANCAASFAEPRRTKINVAASRILARTKWIYRERSYSAAASSRSSSSSFPTLLLTRVQSHSPLAILASGCRDRALIWPRMRTGRAQTTTTRYLHNRAHRGSDTSKRTCITAVAAPVRATPAARIAGPSRYARGRHADSGVRKARRRESPKHSRSVCLARQGTGNGRRATRLTPRSKGRADLKPLAFLPMTCGTPSTILGTYSRLA